MTTDKHAPPPSQPKQAAATPQAPVRGGTPPVQPVGQARHAETPEETTKLEEERHPKIPPPGSRDYVAGQPVNEEEYARTEDEAHRLAAAGKAQEEKEAASRKQHDDPAKNPDHQDTQKDHPKK